MLLKEKLRLSEFSGGESIYGGAFADEFHSRLRFKHRGLVACANAGLPHSNGSQFFISLDRCEWLDRKNTIFGKVIMTLYRKPLADIFKIHGMIELIHWFQVTGDSIYNLTRLGEIETDKNDRPLDPPKITSVEVGRDRRPCAWYKLSLLSCGGKC